MRTGADRAKTTKLPQNRLLLKILKLWRGTLTAQADNPSVQVETSMDGDRRVISLDGDLVRGQIAGAETAVETGLAGEGDVLLDVGKVRRFDSAGAEFLVRRLKAAEGRLLLRNASHNLRSFLEALPPPEVFRGEMTTFMRLPVSDLLVETASEVVEHVSEKVRRFTSLFCLLLYYVFVGPFRGHRPRVARLTQEITLMGVDALPIVCLVAVLMGLILGISSGQQLVSLGGEGMRIFSADMVGVSITREIGPIMTAILIAGRSGSAITAEIGTMAVTEELDGLRVMGLNPIPYLVVPKVISLVIALPCLVVFADLVGVGGGFCTGMLIFGIPFSEYWNQTVAAISVTDVVTGLIKSAVFGLLIGLTGAMHGLMVRGGSTDVGLKTTSSVVIGIAAVICADLFFTAAFYVGDM